MKLFCHFLTNNERWLKLSEGQVIQKGYLDNICQSQDHWNSLPFCKFLLDNKINNYKIPNTSFCIKIETIIKTDSI